MNNIIVNFSASQTEQIIDNFDTNSNAVTGIIVHGNILENTNLLFARQSNDQIILGNNYYFYKDYQGNIITMPLYSNAWLGINPYTDLLSIIKGNIKLTLNQAQINDIALEFLFFVNIA